MRPLLIAVALIALVAASIAVGVFAADWPFWQRAWRWHAAGALPPSRLPGAHLWLDATRVGGPRDLPVDSDPDVSAAVSRLLDGEITDALLVARGDRLLFEYYGANSSAGARVDGRELTLLPLVTLFGAAAERGLGAQLDLKLATQLDEWRDDPRGELTPRLLLQGLSGLEAANGSSLNPFGETARLESGPNFERAALGFEAAWPAGSHYASNPADAQLAGVALARATRRPLADLLRDWVVEPLGFDSVRVVLDRHRGAMSAHCCIEARARDWLSLGLVLAQGGQLEGRRLYSESFAHQVLMASPVAPERALGMRRVELGGGRIALLASGRRRLLLADPSSGTAWLWVATRDFDAAHEAALLAAAPSGRRRQDGP